MGYYYENDVIDLQWVEDLLVAFRDGDPDGNGKVDTIPFATFGKDKPGPYNDWWSGPIMGAFDLPRPYLNRNHEVDGKLYLPFVSPRWKEFTELIPAGGRWDCSIRSTSLPIETRSGTRAALVSTA